MALNINASLKSGLGLAKSTFSNLVKGSIKNWSNQAKVAENVSVGLQKAFTGEISDLANLANKFGNFVPSLYPKYNVKTGKVEQEKIPNINLSPLVGKPLTGVDKTSQIIGEVGGKIGLTLAESVLPTKFLKGTKPVQAVGGGLETVGKNILAGGSKSPTLVKALKTFLGKGVANMGEGVPVTITLAALDYLKKGNAPTAKGLAESTLSDLPIGFIPFVGYGGTIATKAYKDVAKNVAEEELAKVGKQEISDIIPENLLKSKVAQGWGKEADMLNEGKGVWIGKGELKQVFDLALYGKDVAAINKVLPQIPPEYLKMDTIAKRLGDLGISVPKAAVESVEQMSEENLRKEVGATISSRLKNLELKLLGQETPDLGDLNAMYKGGGKGPIVTRPIAAIEGYWQKGARSAQEEINRLAQKGLVSDSKAIRTVVSGLRNLFGGLGTTDALSKARNAVMGGGAWIDESHDIASNMYKYLKGNEAGLSLKDVGKRISSALDPALSLEKVSYDSLSKEEKLIFNTLREGYDFVHDWNFSKGFIDKDTYLKFKGNYVGRGYDAYENLEEITGVFGKRIKEATEEIYGARKDITGWMQEHNVNDPVYIFNKRLAQTGINSTINDYTNYLQREGLYSDTAKDGFTKLSDNFVYGPLKGKYVPNFIAEDFKGYFYENKMANTLYDVFKMYNSSSNVFGQIRNARKTMLTAYNPFVQLGNGFSDNVMGFTVGVDPLTLNKNALEFSFGRMKGGEGLFRFLQRNNAVKNSYSYKELLGTMDSLEKLTKEQADNPALLNKAKDALSLPQKVYAKVDDVYKIAAFKSLLDKGVKPEEALRLVQEGFQNYSNVGKLYDVASKTPLVGNAFVKFQGDLMRIIKNALVNRPIHVASFLGSLYAISRLSSQFSGETNEEREARESRAFIPKIPGLDIPLVWQTPYGELNVARYVSPFYAYTEPGEASLISGITKLLPYQIHKAEATSNPKGELAVQLAKFVQDPLLGPLVQGTILDTDFRGKPISDPNATKWKASTATASEKAIGTIDFLRRQYQPQQITDVENAVRVAQGLPDIYGSVKTMPQALGRLAGLKFEQQGPEQIKKSLKDQQSFYVNQISDLNKKKNSVVKDYLGKKIDKSSRDARIAELDSKIKELQSEIKKVKDMYLGVVNSRKPLP